MTKILAIDDIEEVPQPSTVDPSAYIYDPASDDPILRVAKRFAAGRQDQD